MRYYRYGGQPYQWEYNWKGYPMASSKPPMLTFGNEAWITLEDPEGDDETVIIEEPMIIERKKKSSGLGISTSHLLAVAGLLGIGWLLTRS